MINNLKRLMLRYQDQIWLCLIASGVRFLYFSLHVRSVYFNQTILDSLWIHQWALAIKEGLPYSADAYFRAPLYPYLIAAVYRIGGPNPGIIELLQHLLGICSVVLLYRLGKRLFNRRSGLLAGGMLCFYWVAIFFEGEQLIATLALFLGLAVLDALTLAVSELRQKRRYLLIATTGLLIGFASIARPNFLVLIMLALIWLYSGQKMMVNRKAGTLLKELVLLIIAAAIPILPVTVRNITVAGDPVLIASQGGLNFYLGNNADADGKTAMAPGEAVIMGRSEFENHFRDNITIAGEQIAEAELGRPLTGSEVSSFWFKRSWQFWRTEPQKACYLLMRKLYYFLNGFEISGNKDLSEAQQESIRPLLGFVRLSWIFPLAGLGFVLLIGRQRSVILLLLYIALYGASVIAFFVIARFRLPVVPAFFLLAAAGIDQLVCLWSQRHEAKSRLQNSIFSKRILMAVLMLVCTAVCANSRLMNVDERRSLPAHRMNRAMLLLEQGDWRGAIVAYDEALVSAPQNGEALFGKARAYERFEMYAEALRIFEQIVQLSPGHGHAHLARARILHKLGRLRETDFAYQACLRADPQLAVAYFSYARFLNELNRGDEAISVYRDGLMIEPDNIGGWLNLGATLGSMGQYEAAIIAWERALILDAGNEIAKRNIALAQQALRR